MSEQIDKNIDIEIQKYICSLVDLTNVLILFCMLLSQWPSVRLTFQNAGHRKSKLFSLEPVLCIRIQIVSDFSNFVDLDLHR